MLEQTVKEIRQARYERVLAFAKALRAEAEPVSPNYGLLNVSVKLSVLDDLVEVVESAQPRQ